MSSSQRCVLVISFSLLHINFYNISFWVLIHDAILVTILTSRIYLQFVHNMNSLCLVMQSLIPYKLFNYLITESPSYIVSCYASLLSNLFWNTQCILQAYLFNDYWEDIGTIRSFFEANLALTEHVSDKHLIWSAYAMFLGFNMSRKSIVLAFEGRGCMC